MSETGSNHPDRSSDPDWQPTAESHRETVPVSSGEPPVTGELMPAGTGEASGGARYRPRPSPEQVRKARRRHRRTCLILFVATLLSTFFVGSGYAPLEYIAVQASDEARMQMERAILREALRTGVPPLTVEAYFAERFQDGLQYAIPLMAILLCHEMGHYLVAVRHRVPASLPYFIPLPLPPLGTMGAVILQGRGVANRRQMFDIAVWGPLAGLVATIPVLMYGIQTSEFRKVEPMLQGLELGEPLILQWMIAWFHGAAPDGEVFTLNGFAMAGWVGVFVTALNLLPVGQLDGGHILYTLVGRRAHLIAWLVIIGGCAAMYLTGTVSYILILVLLLLTGVRHPPTANDGVPLGPFRTGLGWLTLSFLVIGFTPEPIIVSQPEPPAPPPVQQPAAEQPPGGEFVGREPGLPQLPRHDPATARVASSLVPLAEPVVTRHGPPRSPLTRHRRSRPGARARARARTRTRTRTRTQRSGHRNRATVRREKGVTAIPRSAKCRGGERPAVHRQGT